MKRLALGIAIAAALINPAPAGDLKEAFFYSSAITYDGGCEQGGNYHALPEDFMQVMRAGFHRQSLADLDAANKIVTDLIDNVGGFEKWCMISKPIMFEQVAKMRK